MRTETVNGKTYKVSDSGTYYYQDTPDDLIRELEKLQHSRIKIKIIQGDQKTGQSWNEEHDNAGTLGRTTGPVKMLILLTNYNSRGGCIILTDSILQLRNFKTGHIFYQHPKFKPSTVEIKPLNDPRFKDYTHQTIVNGKLYGQHKSLRSAQICKAKLI